MIAAQAATRAAAAPPPSAAQRGGRHPHRRGGFSRRRPMGPARQSPHDLTPEPTTAVEHDPIKRLFWQPLRPHKRAVVERRASAPSPAAVAGSGIVSTGRVAFGRDSRVKHAATYAVVDQARTLGSSGQEIIGLLSKTWGLRPPSAVISVTGGAQDHLGLANAGMAVGGSLSSDDEAGLETFVMRNLQYGLAAAARATDAWLFTGGMDTGIMSAAGAHASLSRMTAASLTSVRLFTSQVRRWSRQARRASEWLCLRR